MLHDTIASIESQENKYGINSSNIIPTGISNIISAYAHVEPLHRFTMEFKPGI